LIIRPATIDDSVALAAIYGHHVLHGLGTFEETPPTAEDMAGRVSAINARGLPYLVAETEAGGLLGFAYASPFRPRAAYRFAAEDSIYVAPGQAGRGVGKVLLGAVIDRCAAMGVHQMIAVIGDSANAASIGLHRSLGFEIMGTMPAVGFKHGRWVDIVMMQRPLNGGADLPPSEAGLDLAGA
jgi:phosphinothricin acetyltransferase